MGCEQFARSQCSRSNLMHIDARQLAVNEALRLCGEIPASVDKFIDFPDGCPKSGVTYLYFCAFTLETLGRAYRITPERLPTIRDLSIEVPAGTKDADIGRELERTRQVVLLKSQFAKIPHPQRIGLMVDRLKR